MLDYVEVAQKATEWSRDMGFSSRQRSMAEQLADLANILMIDGYGCPSEHVAAEIMYRNLRHAFRARHDRSLPLFQPVRERRTKPRYMAIDGIG